MICRGGCKLHNFHFLHNPKILKICTVKILHRNVFIAFSHILPFFFQFFFLGYCTAIALPQTTGNIIHIFGTNFCIRIEMQLDAIGQAICAIAQGCTVLFFDCGLFLCCFPFFKIEFHKFCAGHWFFVVVDFCEEKCE